MCRMSWIRGFLNALILAFVLGFAAFGLANVARAQSSSPPIVVEGAKVDPSTLRPYFTGTDPASVQRGVDDLKATGVYSSVSARVENGRVVVSLSGGGQIVNRIAFEGNKTIQKEQLEVEVQSKPRTPYNEAVAEADVGRIKEA